jgi:hypothetical protein
MSVGMRLRGAPLVFLVAYVVLDLCSPLVPGAFSFDPGESVDAVSACRIRAATLGRVVTVAADVTMVPVVAEAPPRRRASPTARSLVTVWCPHAMPDASARGAADDD